MVKFPEAHARIIKKIFICKKCKSKIRAPTIAVIAGSIKCRKCKTSALRTKRKK